MRSAIFLPLLLGAVQASPVRDLDLVERQTTQQVDIDLTLPEIVFFTLASSGSSFGSSLQGVGYKGPSLNYNQVSRGVAGLSSIFQRLQTPPNTYNRPFTPHVSEQANNSTFSNHTGAAASTYQDGNTFQNYASAMSFSMDNSGSAAIAGNSQALAASSSDSNQDPSATWHANFDFSQSPNGASGNATVTYNGTLTANRFASVGANETFSVGACLSVSAGARINASYNTTIIYPLNGTSFGTQIVTSSAFTACEAGTADRGLDGADFGNLDLFSTNPFLQTRALPSGGRPKQRYSLGSIQAAPKHRGGIGGYVSCSGALQQGYSVNKYRLRIKGTYTATAGFVGNITVTSQASTTASCN